MGITISDVRVYGLDEVLQARRSFNSQAKSDSVVFVDKSDRWDLANTETPATVFPNTILGPNDLGLLHKLKIAGDSHAKVCRFVTVYLTLTLPRRVWVDFDTYRVGRAPDIMPDDFEIMSDSTMHTLGRGLVHTEDFDEFTSVEDIQTFNIKLIEYKNNPSSETFMKMKSGLLEGFLQTRRLKVNYQMLQHVRKDRILHRQPEFPAFCAMVDSLPYAEQLIQ
jgi:hypothetical protein